VHRPAKFHENWIIFTTRCVCIAQTILSQAVCPSFCSSVSHTPVLCRYGCTYHKKNFHCRVATEFWFLHTKRYRNILTRNPITRASSARVWKLAIFDQYVALPRIDTWLGSYYGTPIGTRMRPTEWFYFEWSSFEWPQTQILRSRYGLTLDILDTVRDTDLVTMKY